MIVYLNNSQKANTVNAKKLFHCCEQQDIGLDGFPGLSLNGFVIEAEADR